RYSATGTGGRYSHWRSINDYVRLGGYRHLDSGHAEVSVHGAHVSLLALRRRVSEFLCNRLMSDTVAPNRRQSRHEQLLQLVKTPQHHGHPNHAVECHAAPRL